MAKRIFKKLLIVLLCLFGLFTAFVINKMEIMGHRRSNRITEGVDVKAYVLLLYMIFGALLFRTLFLDKKKNND